jgi:hypothetical protein
MADENLSSPRDRSGSGLRRQNFPSTNALSPPSALTVPAIYMDRHSGSRGETTANGILFQCPRFQRCANTLGCNSLFLLLRQNVNCSLLLRM